MLSWLRKTESHHDPSNADPHQHGFDGPIHRTASARRYPLKEQLHQVFLEETNLPENKDAYGGNPIGIAPYTGNWHDGKRQPAGKAYGLNGIDVLTDSPVRRVVFEGKVAKGAELVGGRTLMAHREVIVSCGSLRTPQILMLSGVGPEDELAKHRIKPIINAPKVGSKFHDHVCMAQSYKVSSSS